MEDRFVKCLEECRSVYLNVNNTGLGNFQREFEKILKTCDEKAKREAAINNLENIQKDLLLGENLALAEFKKQILDYEGRKKKGGVPRNANHPNSFINNSFLSSDLNSMGNQAHASNSNNANVDNPEPTQTFFSRADVRMDNRNDFNLFNDHQDSDPSRSKENKKNGFKDNAMDLEQDSKENSRMTNTGPQINNMNHNQANNIPDIVPPSQPPMSNINSNSNLPIINRSNENIISNQVQSGNNFNNLFVSELPINSRSIHIKSNKAYFIGLKSRANNELILFNSNTQSLKTVRIDESCYESNAYPGRSNNFPFENSKYVNIGNGALVTGGTNNKMLTDSAFKISVNENTEKISISKYSNMISKRERHNILFLENLNSVVACSGFYIKNCEITDLTEGKWRKLPDLHEPRGNGTMFYINKKYVYIMGGFKVMEQTGEYLNSLEYIDITAPKEKWNILHMNEMFGKYEIKISAMGVLDKETHNKIILVGGYDGNAYLKSGYEARYNADGQIESFEKKENLLSRGAIFFSNPLFMRISNELWFNFELQARGILYDSQKDEFSILNPANAPTA